ncbi:type II and III secretion system protein family protein, partial [Chitiniphilus eburneus]
AFAAVLAACVLVFASYGGAAERPADGLRLAVGELETVPAPGLSRVAVADPKVADVQLTRGGDTVLVEGRAPGDTQLLLWYGKRDTPQRLKIRVDAEAPRVLSSGARLGADGAQRTLDGEVADAARHAATLTALGAGVDDRTLLASGGAVQVDIKVVEYSRSEMKQAGLNLFFRNLNSGFSFASFTPGSLSKFNLGDTLTSEGSSPFAQAFNLLALYNRASYSIGTVLSLLESNGQIQVLAEPSLVALSGQTATFLAGGELPVPVPQSFGNVTIEWKKFGIGLAISPTVIDARRIALKVAPEASELDYTRGVQLNGTVVPSVTTRRADTTVELGDGESFVIGGLVSRNLRNNVDKVPGIGSVPILGAFFKRVESQREDRELMIVVTPHLVSPLARDAARPPLPGESMTQQRSIWSQWLLGGEHGDNLTGLSQ